jgi:hypothetical protein
MKQQVDIHEAVAIFMHSMVYRMMEKHLQGYRSWDDPAFLPIYRRKMLDCAARVYAGESSQCVDLANWAMIISYCEKARKETMSKAGAG